MNLISLFTKFLDWWNKFSSRLKSIGYLVAVLFGILFIVNNGCKRQQIEELIEKTTGLNVKNDILRKTNKQLFAKIENKDSIIARKTFEIDSINKRLKSSNKRIWEWKSKYSEIDSKLKNIPYDSSYKFTQQVYNYPGEKKYPYNGLQVNGIHKTWLENKNRKSQLFEFEMSLHDCKEQVSLMEEVNNTMAQKYALKESMLTNTDEIVTNKNEEVSLLRNQLKRNSKWFAGFGVGPNISVTYIDGSITPTFGIGVHYNLYKW